MVAAQLPRLIGPLRVERGEANSPPSSLDPCSLSRVYRNQSDSDGVPRAGTTTIVLAIEQYRGVSSARDSGGHQLELAIRSVLLVCVGTDVYHCVNATAILFSGARPFSSSDCPSRRGPRGDRRG